MRALLYITIIILRFLFFDNRLIDKSEYDLSHLSPKFVKVETIAIQTETFVKFQNLENSKFEYRYRLFISKLDKNAYQSNIDFFKNWLYEEEDYDSFLENKTNYWNEWKVLFETDERITKITNLQPSTIILYL